MTKFLEKHYKKIVFSILAFMLAVSVLNAAGDSAIFDETAHIPAGFSYVSLHDMRLNPEHPPLLKDLAGLALLPMHLKFDTGKNFWSADVNGQWDAGRDLLWQEGNDADRIIFWSRIPIILISILLGWFIFKWARELSGTAAGLFALTLYAFDPNILGHNHFVTTDIGIAAFSVFSFYYFLKFIKYPTWKNVFWGGVFLGLVQLVKFSSITLLPVFGLVLLIYPLVKSNRENLKSALSFKLKNFGEYFGKGLIAFIISILLVWGVYFVNIYKMPESKLAETIEFYFPANDSSARAVATNKIAGILNGTNLTRPLSEYFLGIAMVFKRVDGGNGVYFMEQVSGQAFPDYFPAVFILKEPLPNLFFFLFALIISFVSLGKTVRYRVVSLSLFSFIVLYAYISVTGNLNIGFRHLFPILPFAYILTAKAIFDLMKRINRPGSLIWGLIITAASIFLIAETVAAYPAYMSYFNQLAGGSKNGYRYVTDSNADWGQDLKRLKKWIDDYNYCAEMKCDSSVKFGCPKLCREIPEKTFSSLPPIDKIHINYFGGADIKYYFGDRAIDWWDSRRPIEPGWYAISTNYLMGSFYDKTKQDNESYRWIKNIKPIYQVGTSIFIYFITAEDIAQI